MDTSSCERNQPLGGVVELLVHNPLLISKTTDLNKENLDLFLYILVFSKL